MPEQPTPPPPAAPGTLHVIITREPFSDYFTIILDNGHTEELEVEDTRQWFKDRGADKDSVEKVLDHVWNFQRAEAVFDNYHEPSMPKLPYMPKL